MYFYENYVAVKKMLLLLIGDYLDCEQLIEMHLIKGQIKKILLVR